MNKTKIEWVINPDGSQGFTSNPIRGQCRHSCSYCYAEKIRKRFMPEIQGVKFYPAELERIEWRKKPSTIFMGSMHDLFGAWIPHAYLSKILQTVKMCPQHKFIFLTKNPDRYSQFDFPVNCWCGYTDDGTKDLRNWSYLKNLPNRFVSFEPLIGDKINTNFNVIDWVIIGAENRNGNPVDHENGNLINLIIEKAFETGTPVFLKNSLFQLYPDLIQLRETPYKQSKQEG